jgi:hypothetical protein
MPVATSTVKTSSAAGGLSREAIFAWEPSPWEEVKKLQYGSDRSFAHVIENEVLTAAPADFAKLEERILLAFKAPETTSAAKDFLCRMLSLIGSAACVSTLSPLLKDPKMEHFARLVLENIGQKTAI